MKIGNETPQINYSQKKSKVRRNFRATEESYDIRNATYKELTSICNDLYRSGKISLYERGMLTFNPMKSSQWSKITHDKANNEYYLTKENSSGKRDWLLEFEKRIENQRNLGNKLGANHMEKILNKVRKLENIT